MEYGEENSGVFLYCISLPYGYSFRHWLVFDNAPLSGTVKITVGYLIDRHP